MGSKRRRKVRKQSTKSNVAPTQARRAKLLGMPRHLRQARDYPFEGCWTQPDWDQDGLAVIVIARRQPDGKIVFGNYLVDCFCLGLKDTFFRPNVPLDQLRHQYLVKMIPGGIPMSISVGLAHEIIYGAIEYAAQFGFQPHPDFRRSQYILDPSDTHPRTGTVEFGKDGKPLYISGPYDDSEAMLHQLERTAGGGNFDYVVQVGGPLPDDWDDDDPD